MVATNNLFRNLVVASTFASFTVAALSLGGARAPWTSYDSAVTGGGGSTQAYVIEIGVLRQRRCFEGACVTGDTTSFDSCDDVGKTAASFMIMGLISCVLSTLMVFFASLNKGFLASSFFATAVLYSIALITWSEGCHADLKGSLNGDGSSGGTVTNVTFEYGIGFGAAISGVIASLTSLVFMMCAPAER